MQDGLKQLRQEMLHLQERKLYFLMGAAGACIGFAVTQMDGLASNVAVYAFLASLLSFGVSIAAGLRLIAVDARFLDSNSKYLEMASELRRQGGAPDELMKIADREAFTPLGKKRRLWEVLQTGCLLLGAALVPLFKFVDCDACISAWQAVKGN